MKRNLLIGAAFLALIAAVGVGELLLERTAAAQAAQAGGQVPMYQVDPTFPKVPLPNKWVVGAVIGVAVDSRDHIWMIHRKAGLAAGEIGATANPPTSECCVPAPPILEFDQAGTLLRSFGGPGAGYEWPDSEHGLYIDHKDNIWTAGNGKTDSHILKFTQDGKFLLQVGKKGGSQGSNNTEYLGQPAEITVDPERNEVWVADGYRNKRVIVFDADNGTYKRHWGAYGNKPDDADPGKYNPAAPAPQQFRSPVHCVVIAKDGNVYVCDRTSNRIQVFTKDGKFQKEMFIARNTLGAGAVWDLDISRDAQQRFLFNPDGTNQRVWMISRSDLAVVGTFGHQGRWPGGFYGAHNLALDSKQNIYVAETFEGKRLQRFLYKGMGRPTSSSGN